MKLATALVLVGIFATARAAYEDYPDEDLEEFDKPEFVFSARPHTYLADDDLPEEFDWRKVDDNRGGTINLTTMNRNQHIPTYCGSCWAFASTSAMGDRIKIAKRGEWAEINLSPQHLVNCGDAGTCHGGSANAAHDWIARNGIVEETCAPYQAKDIPCTPLSVCSTCNHTDCTPIEKPKKWFVGEHGMVDGEKNMMKEILARGPIACSIASTPQVHAYTGGVFEDTTQPTPTGTNHVISLTGWGVAEDGTPYWHLRNSWGTYWGEQGFMRLVRGKNNILIESRCAWAVPVLDATQ